MIWYAATEQNPHGQFGSRMNTVQGVQKKKKGIRTEILLNILFSLEKKGYNDER